MSVWDPANRPASNGYQPKHDIEGPTQAMVPLATLTTRRPQLDTPPTPPPTAPPPECVGWAAALLPVGAALTMGSLASVYIAVHTEPVYGIGAAVLMAGLVAAIILWGWQR